MSEAAILESRAWFLCISLGIASWSTGMPTNPVEVLPLPTPGIISLLDSVVVEKNRSAALDIVNDDEDNAFIEVCLVMLLAVALVVALRMVVVVCWCCRVSRSRVLRVVVSNWGRIRVVEDDILY